jgi:hypothetical protein
MILDFTIGAGGIAEADEALGWTGYTTLDENVVIADFAIVEEATLGGYLLLFGVAYSQYSLVVLGALVVSGLATLTDGLADVAGAEVTHVSVLATLLAVLVVKQFSTESANHTLPAIALGHSDDV